MNQKIKKENNYKKRHMFILDLYEMNLMEIN